MVFLWGDLADFFSGLVLEILLLDHSFIERNMKKPRKKMKCVHRHEKG